MVIDMPPSLDYHFHFHYMPSIQLGEETYVIKNKRCVNLGRIQRGMYIYIRRYVNSPSLTSLSGAFAGKKNLCSCGGGLRRNTDRGQSP